jgi:L-asparagine transporter-like permease
MTNQESSGTEKKLSPSDAGGLQRRLSQRQLTMMAIGGAIGVGLFLGSSVTIRLAGPAVILSYLLGAGIALIMSYVLTEMAVVHPVAGAFGVYAETYLNSWAGFSVRATYGVAQIIAIGAEVTAAGIYISYWLPNVPQWIWVVLVSVALVALNSMQVNRLGEFEYWFAMIKVAAIVAFIIVGVALIFGFGGRQALGLANLTQHGGFLPTGWKGVWLSLTITVTSYMGVEIIAVTAGEAQNPEVTIPRAMRNIVYRLIGFYVLAIAIMVTMVPWNQTGSSSALSGSPFVTAFASAHIPFAAAIMNFVVLTAALSSVNTNLYLSTRMLFSLGRGGYAPPWMGKVSSNGVPHRALVASTAGIIAAILLAIFAPKNAFLML